MTEKFDGLLKETMESYWKLHLEFDEYRGRELKEEESERVKELFFAIQGKFKEMVEALNFIKHRADLAKEELNRYRIFIDQLKDAGNLKS